MGDFKICFPMNKELDNKTELYDKLVREFGVGGIVRRDMAGSVIEFEVVMDYGVLRLGGSCIVLKLGLDGYGEVFKGILTIDEVSALGGAVKRYRDGNVIDFEVAMRYGVLRLDMSVQVLGLDVYIADALETTVLTPDDLDGLYNELKNADIIRSDKLWYISEDNIFEEVRL